MVLRNQLCAGTVDGPEYGVRKRGDFEPPIAEDHRLRRQARCRFLPDGGRTLPIASLAPERHIGIDRRGAAGGQVAGEKRGAD